MYRVRPLGINTKNNDRDVKDGFLQESINLQWRNDSFKPIPGRLESEINVSGYSDIILHKVGDENQINVIGVKENVNEDSLFLAFDLAEYLAGGTTEGTILEWFGKIVDGTFQSKTVTQIPLALSPGVSFTILNGLMYFMGDGTNENERYYYRVQYNETTGAYEVKNMYAWKSLIPYYPDPGQLSIFAPKNTVNLQSICGIINYRFAIVLKSGEIVLHSPIYSATIWALNRSASAIAIGDTLQNIHTIINLDLSFADTDLYDEEVSAINVYASIPYFNNKVTGAASSTYNYQAACSFYALRSELFKQAEQNFYLINTITEPTDNILVLRGSDLDQDIEWPESYIEIDMNTIAAGEVMPEDDFTYHKIFGKISTYNGRMIVSRPVTVLSEGHIRSLATVDTASDVGFRLLSEDGKVEGIAYSIDKALTFSAGIVTSRGILSYPHYQANIVGGNSSSGGAISLYKCRANNSHNLSCVFDSALSGSGFGFYIDENASDASEVEMKTKYSCLFTIASPDETTGTDFDEVQANYSSDNRIQFSDVGEFSVWPAINSYRIGEGKVMAVGDNSVNPSNADIIAPLIIGTTDGVFTINLDPRGTILVASITKTANLPYVSEETLQVEGFLIFVSDKGLMAIHNGDIINLTNDYFPDHGDGNFPDANDVYSGYNALTTDFFGGSGNIYDLIDIVAYMKGAVLAYDGRRNNIWCCNSGYNYSLIYNTKTQLWTLSTFTFDKKVELFSTITIDGEDIFSRFMVLDTSAEKLFVLSGEDLETEVDFHLLTRPIKFGSEDSYKVVTKMYLRCMLQRATANGYFALGLWGRQDVNKNKKALMMTNKKSSSTDVFPFDIRNDIPISMRKGKYKSVTVLLTGLALPESDIMSFDFDAMLVDNSKMR